MQFINTLHDASSAGAGADLCCIELLYTTSADPSESFESFNTQTRPMRLEYIYYISMHVSIEPPNRHPN